MPQEINTRLLGMEFGITRVYYSPISASISIICGIKPSLCSFYETVQGRKSMEQKTDDITSCFYM